MMARSQCPIALVVNDDPAQSRLVAALLEQEGVTARSFVRVEDALRFLVDHGPVDLIVTDLYMPGIDGWRFCRLLRSSEYAALNAIPILVISWTYAGVDARLISADLGANAFLPAPFEPSSFRSAVRDLLDGRTPVTPLTALIVEDNPLQSEVLKQAFEAKRYVVHVAKSGEQGRVLFRSCTPQVVILNDRLPDTMGIQLLGEFKQQEAPTVIIMMTGNPTPALALEFIRKGADAYVHKPFEPGYLIELCEKARRERSLLWVRDLLEVRTKALRESEARYALAVGGANDGLWDWNVETDEVYCSARTMAMVGLTEREAHVPRSAWLDRVHPEDRDQATAELQAHLDGFTAYYQAEYRVRHEDGSYIWVLDRGMAPRNGSGIPRRMAGSHTDITKRKRAEVAHRMLTTAIEQSAEAIMITDTAGLIEYVNPAFEQMTGYSRPEALGRNPRLLRSGRQQDTNYQEMWGALMRGEVWSGRLTDRRKDGSLIEVAETISPVRDAAGCTVNYVAVLRDVTREARIEAQLRQSQRMQAIGELAGGVAHDFNNLLATIMGSASLIKIEGQPEDRVIRAADLIEQAAERAARLTGQLLGFAKRGKHHNVPVDLHDAIEEVVAFLSRSIDKRITITQQLQAQRAVVMGDPDQIQQVLLNIAINARDAMPDGGTLTFETGIVELDVEYCRWHVGATPGRYVMVAITDTGHGIPPEVQDRVFEPFFSAKQGTGMGLAMVYGIVKNHGGSIRLYSEVGLGTTFKVYLPLADVDAPPSADVTPLKPFVGHGRILFVDDEPFLRESSAALLQQLGYEVVTVEDGRQAVAYYRDHGQETDLIILDLVMPGWGGQETFRALQAIDPSVKVVISTGYGHNEAVQALLDEGVAGFVPKPYTLRALTEVLSRVLGRKA